MKTLLLRVGLIGGMIFSFYFTTLAQSYNTGYPAITNKTTTTAIAEVNATIGGSTGGYLPQPTTFTPFIVLPSTSPITPTDSNVMDWALDGNGGIIPEGQRGVIGLFTANETYSLEITGLAPNTSYIAYFVTTQDGETSAIETTAPTPVEFTTRSSITFTPTTPPDGSTNVSVDTDLTMTFSDNISRGTGYIEIHKGISSISSINIDQAIFTENTLTLPSAKFSLDYATEYHIEIEAGVIQGFSGISDAETWNFTTETGPPNWTTAPYLSNQTETNITLIGKTDLDGTVYYGVTANDETIPSPEQIIDGETSSFEFSQTGEFQMDANLTISEVIPISTLNDPIEYYVYVIAVSTDEKYDANEVIELKEKIDLAPPRYISMTPQNGSVIAPVETDISITFSERLYDGTTGGLIIDEDVANYIQLLDANNDAVSFSASISTNGSVITLNPTQDLSANSQYTITFDQFQDQLGNLQTLDQLIPDKSFETDGEFTWTGNSETAPTSWSDANNWVGSGFVDKKSVIIPATATSFPVVEAGENLNVNNLTIEAGASLTQNGGSLTISGVFTLESSVNGNASYLPLGGTLTLASSATTRFHQHIEASDRNYNFGVSADGTTKTSAGITSTLYRYNNDNNTYVQLDGSTELIPGTGYICQSDNSIVFTGTPVTADKQVSVQRNNSGGLGWNLISNPFTATSDFTKLAFDTMKVANSFWIWDNIEKKYNTYNAASDVGIGIPDYQSGIPAHQAFWVKVLPGVSTTDITFTTSSLQANSYSYLKSASSTLFPTFKMEADFNGKKDEMAVVFASDGVPELGDRYDTEKKLTLNEDFFQIFTTHNSTNLAINGMPPSETEVSIPLNFKVAKTGIVTFNVKTFTLPPNAQVILEDKELNDFISLNPENSYQFEVSQTGTNKTRFVLHFSGTAEIATDINEPEKDDNSKKARFYTNNSEIIAYIGQLNNPTFRLLDLNGKVIDSGRLNPESENRIMVSRKGMVILIVESEKEKLEFKTVF